MISTLEWTNEGVRFLDQTRLPLEESYVLATTYQQVADVIVTMVVRGAPAIGVSAAMGVALGLQKSVATTIPALMTGKCDIAMTPLYRSSERALVVAFTDLYSTIADQIVVAQSSPVKT